MNRYQQILADKKINNGADLKFLLNQEGFYSPTRDYQKYKKMEEFQLPDIKKYNFFPMKPDKNKHPLHIDNEPTAFQNYKKSQQITFKKIEDKSQSSRNNELQNIQLQSISNNNYPLNISQNALNQQNQIRQNVETEYGLNSNKQRLSLQNIISQSSKCSAKNQNQESTSSNDNNSGYNVIQSHRFRVSSLEKIKNSQIETLQQGINDLIKNKDQNEPFVNELNNTSINQSLNTSLQKIIEMNKQPKIKNKRQFNSYHYDSSSNLVKQDSKMFALSDIYLKLRQSLEDIDKCSDPLTFSERVALKSNSPEQNFQPNKKQLNTNRYKNDKQYANNSSNQTNQMNYTQSQQQNDLKDTLQNFINIQNEKIEIQIKNSNPYMFNSKDNKPQTIQQSADKDLNVSESSLVKTDFIDKRKNQYGQIKNMSKDESDSTLLGSTKFLNFLPHHIKKKKIQQGIQLSQGVQSMKQSFPSLEQQNEEASQNVVHSYEINRSPQNKQNKEIIQKPIDQNQISRQLSLENQYKIPQNIQNQTSQSTQYQQSDYFKSKALECNLQLYLTKQNNSQKVKEGKYYHIRMQSNDKNTQDHQIYSRRDFTYDQTTNIKPQKQKFDEKPQYLQQNQNRQTFTKFLPWENPKTINNFELKKQQLNYKQAQNYENSPKNSLNKNNLISVDNSYNSSHYDRKFIDFDIQDYFLLKEKI